jgi:ubiquinone/menaquinone biosynthesis C-methylase UbiE
MLNTSDHNASDVRLYYNTIAGRYFDLFKNELDEKECDRKLLDKFVSDLPANARVCDAGCGPCAHTTAYLAAKGLHVVGTDISENCIEIARRAHPDLYLSVMDMQSTAFADESLDGILAYYSIIYTPKKFLSVLFAEFHRTLKRNGKLFIAVKEGEGERVIADLLGSGLKTLFVWFTEAEIRSLLQKHGFHIELLVSRNPLPSEIKERRLFAIGVKT